MSPVRKIKCYECGKTYDYNQEDFCPRCGAYTQPKKHLRFDGQGRIVRVDGINEQNHHGSFVHAERHQEEKQRRQEGLSRMDSAAVRPAVRSRTETSKSSRKKNGSLPVGVLVFLFYLLYTLFRLMD